MRATSLPVLLRALAAENDWLVIPAREGGRLFRLLADELGLREAQVADCARRIGLWPYAPGSPAFAVPVKRPGEREARERLGEALVGALAETGVPVGVLPGRSE